MKKKLLIIATVAAMTMLLLSLTACGLDGEKKTVSSGDLSLDACYAVAVDNGFEGSMDDFLKCLKGESAYDLAVENGYTGSESEWLTYLKGKDGMDGKNAAVTAGDLYDEAVERGYAGTYFDFLREYLNVTNTNKVASNAVFASVSVYCGFDIPYTNFSTQGYQSGTQVGYSAGSGIIYSLNKDEGSAYIVTNYHLVYNAESTQDKGISDNILVYLYGSEVIGNELYTEEYVTQNRITGAPDYRGMGINATYVGGSQNYDIAVLYVENSDILKNSNATAVEFADSNAIAAGQVAYAIGNAESKGISVTKGVVSVDSENLRLTVADNGEYTSFRVIRVDAAINLGNSGGGVFDDEGKMIGIVNAKTNVYVAENIGYALPSNVVKYIVQNILDYKDTATKNADVRKCMLGIAISSRESSAVLDDATGKVRLVEKVMVNEITENGLAKGKLEAGDILVSAKIHHVGDAEGVYEEYAITRSFIIVDLMLTMRVGDTLEMTYDRPTEDGVVRGTVEFVMTEECINEVS